MAKTSSDDILLPGTTDSRARRASVAAFVPIVVALAGVAAVLLGGVSARDVVASGSPVVDPMVTGSVNSTPASEADRERWE